MGQESVTQELVVSALHSLVLLYLFVLAASSTRYAIVSAYVVCFYDWIITMDQEFALIYPAPWNAVKVAHLFCRYYPMAIAPFHFWGFLLSHEQSVCESSYHALYVTTIPTILSAQFILMLRTYAFSGRKKKILAILSIAFFSLVGVIIWVTSTQLSLTLLFLFENTSCFAVSDQSSASDIHVPIAYHQAMISIFTTFFDGLNMFIVFWYCIRRGTLGPLGQSFLKQGIVVYVVMTALNALTTVTFLVLSLEHGALGSSAWFANILPSALACRLVLSLRQKASPTETHLRLEHSHIINEAFEMIAVEEHSAEISKSFRPSISTNGRAEP